MFCYTDPNLTYFEIVLNRNTVVRHDVNLEMVCTALKNFDPDGGRCRFGRQKILSMVRGQIGQLWRSVYCTHQIYCSIEGSSCLSPKLCARRSYI